MGRLLVTVHTHPYPEVFWHEYAKSRDMRKILAAGNLNDFGYVTVNGVNSNDCYKALSKQ